jgi:hypothetical protein
VSTGQTGKTVPGGKTTETPVNVSEVNQYLEEMLTLDYLALAWQKMERQYYPQDVLPNKQWMNENLLRQRHSAHPGTWKAANHWGRWHWLDDLQKIGCRTQTLETWKAKLKQEKTLNDMKSKRMQELMELIGNPDLPVGDIPLFWECLQIDGQDFYVPESLGFESDDTLSLRLTKEQFDRLNEKFLCFLQ